MNPRAGRGRGALGAAGLTYRPDVGVGRVDGDDASRAEDVLLTTRLGDGLPGLPGNLVGRAFADRVHGVESAGQGARELGPRFLQTGIGPPVVPVDDLDRVV